MTDKEMEDYIDDYIDMGYREAEKQLKQDKQELLDALEKVLNETNN